MTMTQFERASLKSCDSISVRSLEGVELKMSVPVFFILSASLAASFVSSSDAKERVSPLNRGAPHSFIEKSKDSVVTAVITWPLSTIPWTRIFSL